jgi:hypothetical protein
MVRGEFFRLRPSRGRKKTRVLLEQTTVIDPDRHERSARSLDADELRAVGEALSLLLGL